MGEETDRGERMSDRKKNARPVGSTTEQAVGADFAGHVPSTDFNTIRMELRHFFAGVIR